MSGRVVCLVTACLLTCVIVLVKAVSNKGSNYLGPQFEDKDFTTCKEFSRHSRFNPYSVMDDIWVPFYFFGPSVKDQVYQFYAPSARRKKLLQKLLNDSVTVFPVNWTQPIFIMKEIKQNMSELIVQTGVRGQFIRYPILKKLKPGQRIAPHDIYFKQSEGGKYLTFMHCIHQTAYVMARPTDIPRKSRIQDEVAKVGVRGRDGMSYLYQGHKWMPIPEADERQYPPEIFYLVHDKSKSAST